MAESLLANIPHEGDPLEEKDEEGKETPPESPPEKKTSEKEPPQEGEPEKVNTPEEEEISYKKKTSERFQTLLEHNQSLKKAVEELSKFREEAEPKLKELGQKGQPVPSWFANTFGENEQAWEQYQGYEKELRQKIKDEFYQEQEELGRQQEAEQKKWSDWTSNQLQQMKDDGLKFDQNELLKVLVEYKPMDDEGNLNFRKGYEILSKIKVGEEVEKSKKTGEKKKIAGATMEGGEGGEQEKKYRTSKDLRNKDWTDLAV